METLLALTVSATLALGCLAIGFGLLVVNPDAAKAAPHQKSNEAGQA
jgi:hypothetical protein